MFWTKWAKYSVEKGSRSSLIERRTEVSLEGIWPRGAVRTLVTIMDQNKLVVQQLHNCGWIIKMVETMHFLFIDWDSPFRICYFNNLHHTKQYYALDCGHAYILADCHSSGTLNRAYCIITAKDFVSATEPGLPVTLYLCTCPTSSEQCHRLKVINNYLPIDLQLHISQQ